MKTIIHRLFITNYLFDWSTNGQHFSATSEINQAIINGKTAKRARISTLLIGSVMALAAAFTMSSCSSPKEDGSKLVLSKEALIEKGRFLVSTSACHDCHSPKIMTPHGPVVDTARMLSGNPASDPIPPVIQTNDWVLFGNDFTYAAGPWGVSFAANLTPHDTGTGSWSFEQFKTAIRKGKYKGLEGSRSLLPPMPWEVYMNFGDEDLLAIFTFLQSIKPIDNLVRSPIAPEDIAAFNQKINK